MRKRSAVRPPHQLTLLLVLAAANCVGFMEDYEGIIGGYVRRPQGPAAASAPCWGDVVQCIPTWTPA